MVSEAPRPGDGRTIQNPRDRGGHGQWTDALPYSLAAGAVATVGGAAASLVAVGKARLIVWCVVAGIICVMAGAVHGMASVTAWWTACRRRLRRLGDF
jgi:hypothetical protein